MNLDFRPRGLVHVIVIYSQTPRTIYLGIAIWNVLAGIFKRIDGGDTWNPANTGLPPYPNPNTTSGPPVYALAIDPTKPTTLYAGTNAGVFKSTNSGGNWTALGLSNLAVNAIAIDPKRPGLVYAGTSAGVFSIEQTTTTVCRPRPEALAAPQRQQRQQRRLRLEQPQPPFGLIPSSRAATRRRS